MVPATRRINAIPLMGLGHGLMQKPGAFWSECGESDIDEVVAALEQAFRSREPAAVVPNLSQWNEATAGLVQIVREVHPNNRS